MDLECDDHTAHHTAALPLSRVSGEGVWGWQTKVHPRYPSQAFQTPSSLTLGKNIEISFTDKSIGEDRLFTLKVKTKACAYKQEGELGFLSHFIWVMASSSAGLGLWVPCRQDPGWTESFHKIPG